MAGAAPNRTPNHNGKRACPQSDSRLQDYINKGLAEFSPVVEVIRLLFRDEMCQSKLITDFIRFRDVTAHKCVYDIAYRQMIAAFVRFCREKVMLGDIALETTKVLPSKFARMADINFVVCATWYVNMLNHTGQTGRKKKQVEDLRNSLKNYATDSSFFEYKFYDKQSATIYVHHHGTKKELNDTLLLEFAQMLITPVDYLPDEIAEFKKLYKKAAIIAKTGTTHPALQPVLNQLEQKCNCPTKSEKKQPDKDAADIADLVTADSTPSAVQGVPYQFCQHEDGCNCSSVDGLAVEVKKNLKF